MSVVVRCPECSKKLKVGENLVGRRVKCSCGNVFVANEDAAVAAPPPAADGTEKVVVPCTECGAKLKVPGAKLGKKMKCPTCGDVFIAAAAAPKPAAPVAPPAPAEDDIFSNIIDEESPAVQAARMLPPEPEPNLLDDDEEIPVAKPRPGKAKPVAVPSFADDEEEEAPFTAKPVARKGKGKAARRVDDDDDDVPTRKVPVKKQSKAFVNTLVGIIVVAYSAFTAAVYFDILPLEPPAPIGPIAGRDGSPKKGGPDAGKKDNAGKKDDNKTPEEKADPVVPIPEKKDDDKKPKEDKTPPPAPMDYAELLKERQGRDMELLTELKEKAPKDMPGVMAVLEPNAGSVRAIAFSPIDSKVAAITSSELKIWDLKTGEAEKTIGGFKTTNEQLLVFSPDGKLLATTGVLEPTIKIFQVESGELVKSLAAEKWTRGLAFSPNSAELIGYWRNLGEAPVVKIWQTSDWTQRVYSEKADQFSYVALSPDGTVFAEVIEAQKKVFLHNVLTGEKREKASPYAGSRGLALSPDNRLLLAIDPDSQEFKKSNIGVLDLETGEARAILSGKSPVFFRPEFSPDGKYICYNATAKSATDIVDVATGALVTMPPDGPIGRSFSSGGIFYAVGDDKGAVKVFELAELMKNAAKGEPETKGAVDEKKVVEKKEADVKKVDEKKIPDTVEPDQKQAAKALNKALSATMRRSPAAGILLGIVSGASSQMGMRNFGGPTEIRRTRPPFGEQPPPPPKEIEKEPAPPPF